MSLEFAKKEVVQVERLIYIRNMNTVEVNIYYQGDRERTEISLIGG